MRERKWSQNRFHSGVQQSGLPVYLCVCDCVDARIRAHMPVRGEPGLGQIWTGPLVPRGPQALLMVPWRGPLSTSGLVQVPAPQGLSSKATSGRSPNCWSDSLRVTGGARGCLTTLNRTNLSYLCGGRWGRRQRRERCAQRKRRLS